MLRLFAVVITLVCCEAIPSGYGGGGFAPILTGGLSSLSNHINTPIGASYSGLGLGYNTGPIVSNGPVLGLGGPVGLDGPLLAGPQVLDVVGSDEPVQVIFRSLGARVHVQQLHTPSGPQQVEQHRTEEEPHRVLHEILRPVIQEVREVIQPYRRVTQEVRPVLEEVHTVVAKSDHGASGLAGNALSGGHGGYSSSKKA